MENKSLKILDTVFLQIFVFTRFREFILTFLINYKLVKLRKICLLLDTYLKQNILTRKISSFSEILFSMSRFPIICINIIELTIFHKIRLMMGTLFAYITEYFSSRRYKI